MDKDAQKNFFTGICTIIAAFITVWGVFNTINSNQELKNQELLNSLDQKSEWRKELMNIAAKPVMQREDVYRILASLRFLPKSKVEIEGEESKQQKKKKGTKKRQKGEDGRQSNEEGQKDKGNQKDGSDQKEFDVISNYIYKRLNTMLNEKLNNISVNVILTDEILNRPFSIKKSEEIRLYTKFLLKHHWEYNKGEKDKKKFKKKELEEFKNVIREIHRLNENDSIRNDYYKINDIYTGDLETFANRLNNERQGK
ncbi:hypothetical protein ACHK7U_02295 [Staphylococcus hominis]|uniref:hypothetical protein n=1 Tax=Staphylococcus hominis TaxID=1290 RepID=UPI0039BFC92C